MNNPNLQKSKKKKKIKKKSSKEISVRDHSDYKRYQKKVYAIKTSHCLLQTFMEIVNLLRTKSFPHETSKNRKKNLKNS